MTTTWKSGDDKSTNQKSAKQATNNNTISGTTLSSWSRQQKLAMIAGFGILGLLLAVSACSKQSPKPALVGVSSPASNSPTPAATATPAATSAVATPTTATKKTHKKRPANVTYTDPNSGVSFLYPRKFALTAGDKAQPQFAVLGDASMNFVQPGGFTVATVEMPAGLYPGTDFASGFFNVNVNRSVSEQECGHFAVVDSHNIDGAPVDAEKVEIGSTDMETTSNFSASAMTQSETQYYHSYENGACYEYVLSVGTAGYGAKDGVEPVNRDEVFAKLEKILATVKINPVEQEKVAEQAVNGTTGKE
ncbi:MAG: hypothetical protein LAO30_03170 [Acidobacteriia bacterium]|nr:hypothetical protein [Terriglobia bacterium]